MSDDRYREGMNGGPALSPLPEINPVARRPKIVQTQISRTEPQSSAITKLADAQLQQCARLNSMDADLVELGSTMIAGFLNLDQRVVARFENVDRLMLARFDALERKLFGPAGEVAYRAKQESGQALERFTHAIGELKEDVDEIKTSPGFDAKTGKTITRAEYELNAMKAKFEASEAERLRLERAAEEIEEERKEVTRARRTAVYGVVGGIAFAVIVAVFGVFWSVAKTQSAHDAGVIEGRQSHVTESH